MVLMRSSCDVDTVITVQFSEGGSGVITVSLSLDEAALDAVGGTARLSEVAVGAGWDVSVEPALARRSVGRR